MYNLYHNETLIQTDNDIKNLIHEALVKIDEDIQILDMEAYNEPDFWGDLIPKFKRLARNGNEYFIVSPSTDRVYGIPNQLTEKTANKILHRYSKNYIIK